MRFTCHENNKNNLIFFFKDSNESIACERCLTDIDGPEEKEGLCEKNRYLLIRYQPDQGLTFRFCLKEAKTRKQAKYHARLAIKAYVGSQEVYTERASLHENATALAIHNTRNLNAEINSKLLSLVDEDELSSASDKVQYIQDRVSGNPRSFAREILSVLKSTGQIMSEYSVIDLMEPSVVLHRADFQRHRIHTLCVMSYYLYEQELTNRRLRVILDRSDEYCLANFSSARTAISQLFDNCLKYCKSGSDIKVEFIPVSADIIEMSFEMTSLFFDNSSKATLTLPGVRGEYANELDYEGKGAGLGIVQRMMELNHGYFVFECVENTLFYSDEIPYATCRFVLGFMRDK